MAHAMTLEHQLQPLAALTDETRVRLLALLADDEMTVAELVEILGAPQSRVSTHLGRLKDAGMVRDRSEGVFRYYRAVDDDMPPAARAAWTTLRPVLARDPAVRADKKRRAELLARDGASWADRVAGSLERHYSPGRTWEALARGFALLPTWGDVVDLGAGDGAVATLLAPQCHHVTCVDLSPRMVAAGRERIARLGLGNVTFVEGDIQDVPVPDASADLAFLHQSLQFAADPARALREAARVVRPGGRVLVITLAAHREASVVKTFGHVHLGFEPAALRKLATRAGLEVEHLTAAGREKRAPHFETLAMTARRPATSSGRPKPMLAESRGRATGGRS